MIVTALLWMSLAGLLCCTGFLVLAVVATLRFRSRRTPDTESCPPVTLLKPLCGLEPNLQANLASFFDQDYPDFEIVFGTRDAADPAIEVVRAVQQLYPHVPVKVVYSGEPDRPNAKVCSLERMYAAASHDHLVVSDSDVHVNRDYIRRVVRPLLDPKVGLAFCLYRGVPTGGLWSRLEALGMSVEMTAGVAVSDLLEDLSFALGPTMATRRDVVDQIGGFGVLADYCADDYVLGDLIHSAGYKVVLSEHIIDHVVLNRSFAASMLHQLRWMKSARFSRPLGHVLTVLTFAMPFGIVGACAAWITGSQMLAASILVSAILNRILLSVAVGGLVVRDRRTLTWCWLYPLRDCMGFFFWAASFVGRTIVWRHERYRLHARGRMERLEAATQTTAGYNRSLSRNSLSPDASSEAVRPHARADAAEQRETPAEVSSSSGQGLRP